MATHVTPTELARELGMERRAVIAACLASGVPILRGEIDRTLFIAAQREAATRAPTPAR